MAIFAFGAVLALRAADGSRSPSTSARLARLHLTRSL
jgi:hypothetical protein